MEIDERGIPEFENWSECAFIRGIVVLFVVVLMFSSPAIGQLENYQSLSTDNLYKWIDDHAESNNESYPDIAYFTLSRALALEDYGLAARIHDLISYWNYINYEINGVDTIIYHRIKQIEYDKKAGNQLFVGKGYKDLAYDYVSSNELKKAQDTLLVAADIFERLNDELELSEVHLNLAELYNDLGDHDKAIYFSKLCHPIFVRKKDNFRIVDALTIGFTRAYLALENFPKAIASIDQGIEICGSYEFEQKEYLLIRAINLKAEILLKQNELSEASQLFDRAWQLSQKQYSTERSDKYRYGIGRVYYQENEYKKALPHLLAAVNASESLAGFGPDYYKVLSECFEKLQRYEEALAYHIKSTDLSNQISKDKIANLESEALVKYETNIKDENLKEQAQVISNKNEIQGLMIGVGALLLLLLSALFYFFKRNQKTSDLLSVKNQLIEERNQQNELLLKEIHHRVKNNLQTISSLLNLQSESISDQESYDAVLESKNRVGSMALIHQKLYQGENLAAIEMKDYFTTVGKAILDSFGTKATNIALKVDMPEVELDVDTAVPIGLITNELITNSIKHAFSTDQEGEIRIVLMDEGNGLLKLNVSDNGQLSAKESMDKKSKGFGTLLVQLLTTQLGGTVEHIKDAGTATIIQFPIQEKSVA